MMKFKKIRLAGALTVVMVCCWILYSSPSFLHHTITQSLKNPLIFFDNHQQMEESNLTANVRFKNQLAVKIEAILNQIYTSTRSFKGSLSHEDLQIMLDHLDDMLRSLEFPTSRTPSPLLYNEEVCQEKYSHKKNAGGENVYFDQGFSTEECSGTPEFSTLLTLVYNFVHYHKVDLQMISRLFANINQSYSNIEVIAALPSGFKLSEKVKGVTIDLHDVKIAETDIWSKLLAKVKTKYVYIGRNAVHFTKYDRLERLVREIKNIEADVVAGAFRTLRSGQVYIQIDTKPPYMSETSNSMWSHGCEQSTLHNYTLIYETGYEKSIEECMLCHHVQGPFVAKTKLFTEFSLKSSMTGTSGFAVWFLVLTAKDKLIISCPDSMSYVTDDSQLMTSKQDWAGLARFLHVESIYPSKGSMLEYDCDEAGTDGSCASAGGMALSHCCMKQLMRINQLTLKHCKEKGLLCELLDGTMLGSMKFGGILPWELDSDLTLARENLTAFSEQIVPLLTNHGYKVNKFLMRGKYSLIFGKHWFVEVFARALEPMMTEDRISRTLILYDGVYVPVTLSPGLYVRNRYRKEIYKHVQHWRHVGLKSGFEFYDAGKFVPCSSPGHHACLDRYIPDGTLQFKEPIR